MINNALLLYQVVLNFILAPTVLVLLHFFIFYLKAKLFTIEHTDLSLH